MDIKCLRDPVFGGYVTFVVFEGDDNSYYDDFCFTKEELFVAWRIDVDRYREQLRAEILQEIEDEKKLIDMS